MKVWRRSGGSSSGSSEDGKLRPSTQTTQPNDNYKKNMNWCYDCQYGYQFKCHHQAHYIEQEPIHDHHKEKSVRNCTVKQSSPNPPHIPVFFDIKCDWYPLQTLIWSLLIILMFVCVLCASDEHSK